MQAQSHPFGPSKIAYIELEEAWPVLVGNIGISLDVEVIDTTESFGRVVARDVVSPSDVPPHDSSHLDGYACRSEDLKEVGPSKNATLKVVGKVKLGEVPSFHVDRGQSARIFTGCYLPRGTDCVLGIEDVVRIQSGDEIIPQIPLKKTENVYRAGSDVRKGSIVLTKDSILRAQDVAFLANLRLGKVEVLRRPRVGIISTGGELVDPFSDRQGIPETHSLLLKALVESAGGTAKNYGIVEDDPMKLESTFRRALLDSEMLLTIGGSSVGEADLVSSIINKIGKPGVLVHGIKLDPGRVAGFGVVGGKPIIICPGLVQSTLNAFIVLGLPVLRKLLGFEPISPTGMVSAQMREERVFRKRFASFKKITYVNLKRENGLMVAEPVVGETPMVSILSKANAYVITEANREMLHKGETVDAHLLPGFSDDLILKG